MKTTTRTSLVVALAVLAACSHDPGPTQPADPSGWLVVTPGVDSVFVGDTAGFAAVDSGSPLPVNWAVSDSRVAAIEKQAGSWALVRALHQGTTTVTATKGISTASAVLVVDGSQLAFTRLPTTMTAGVITPAVTVTIEDPVGQAITSATSAVTVALDSSANGATLSGTTTVTAVNGVASFPDLLIQKAGGGYRLTASSQGSFGSSSAPFAVTAAAPARLNITIQPNTTWVARSITPGVQVAILDAFSNVVSNATNAVTLAIGRNPGGAALTGTTTVNAVNGVATFSNLSIDKPSADYTLVASATGLTGVETAPFVIITPPISVSVDPFGDVVLGLNAPQLLTATVTNDPSNAGVTWSLNCSGGSCGALSSLHSASGTAITYTTPSTVPHPNSVFVTATSVSDASKSATAWLTIRSSISLSVSPGGFVGVDVNTIRQFTATVSNDPGNLGVTWTVTGCSGTACGTISPGGLYTAPATVPTPVTVTVAATSVTDYQAAAYANVVVTTPGVVTVLVCASWWLAKGVCPTSADVCTDNQPYAGSPTCRFGGPFGSRRDWFTATAYVFNDPAAAGVSWSAGLGSISATSSASGVGVRYTGPPGTCGKTGVTATSVADPTKVGTIAVTLYCY